MVFGFGIHYKSNVDPLKPGGGGETGSFPVLTRCCCSPRSCPRGEHAPRHLCSHRDTWIHPLPGRGRAPGHAGQVEQRRTSPANREGNGAPGEGCVGAQRGFRPSCPLQMPVSITGHPAGPACLSGEKQPRAWDDAVLPYQLWAELIRVLVWSPGCL